MNTRSNSAPASVVSKAASPVDPHPLNTQLLFPKGSKERTIIHDNTEYRLRITAQGKLILTK
jgi:hemin uptake protein HemP